MKKSLSVKNLISRNAGRRPIRVLVVVSLVAAISAISAISAIALVGLGAPAPPTTASPNAATVPQGQPDQQLVKLRAGGFEQTEASRAAGQFVLVVELGKDFRDEAITVQLKREDGAMVSEVQVPAGIPVGSREVSLPSGLYTLTVINHTDWICRISIQ